ncbi:Mfs quinate transporter protein [Mycena venus]|uniref:Mfs quinate transporter protein n=1 Tax=Mycena venus TaxID=2733690 RepID=A0A8H6YG33_9AGAR|nr:Mfs quinate transporter protein [Mycena venus]
MLKIGMLTVTESIQWLVQKGCDNEAWESLKWIHMDDSETHVELKEIQVPIAEEQVAQSGFQYTKSLFGCKFLFPSPVSNFLI